MKFKMNLLVAAVALVAAGAANANFQLGNQTTNGNSSVAFVALDNTGAVSVAIDLNTTLTSFLAATSLTSGAGSLSGAGSTASWNFSTNTFIANGSTVAGNTSWATPMAAFLADSHVVANGYQWGVVAGDGVNNAKSASNLVTGQNLLFTAGTIDFNTDSTITTGALNNGTGNVSNFYASLNGTGTNTATVKGGTVSTGGATFLGTTMAANLTGDFGAGDFGNNNYLSAVGSAAFVAWANSTNPVKVFALGSGSYASTDATFDPTTAATFNFDGSTLSYSVAAVPEPESYAMLIAGLGALVFVARRRKNA